MTKLSILLLAMGCRGPYVGQGVVDGQQRYEIECERQFSRCQKTASELCPDGYDTLQSQKVQGHGDDPAHTSGQHRYQLKIACSTTFEGPVVEPAADSPGDVGSAFRAAP